MSPTVICFKCKNAMKRNESILCSKCENYFHFDCVGCSEKLYTLMDAKKKQEWTCPKCTQTQNKKIPVKSDDHNNITYRKKQTYQMTRMACQQAIEHGSSTPSTSAYHHIEGTLDFTQSPTSLQKSNSSENIILTEEKLDDTFQTIENNLSMSFELSNDLDIVTELKLQINQLQLNLQSADCELKNTIIEKKYLKQQVEKLTREIYALRNIVYKTPIKRVRNALQIHLCPPRRIDQ